MATRTISNAGGNYNATGTWVEGIVPTSADDVVATATSGQLTVNVSSAARSFDFTNYVNTVAVNASWTVSGVATQTFVSGMTITGTASIILTGAAAAITTNGKLIPNLQLGSNKTLNDILKVVNLVLGTATYTGFQMDISGNLSAGVFPIGGNTIINLIGSGTVALGNYQGSGGININTSGTLTGSTIGIGLALNTTLNYSAGTLSLMKLKLLSSPITINGNGVEFETFDYSQSLNTVSVINIPTQLKVKYVNVSPQSATYNPTTTNLLRFTGAGGINVTESMNIFSNMVNNGGDNTPKVPVIELGTGVTHTINSLNIYGFQGITTNTTAGARANAILKSTNSGVQASIDLLTPSSSFIVNTDLTDINFVNLGAYVLSNSTLSNCTNASIITIPGSTGSTGGGSFTFVN
jgi:hypothetical protein